MRIFENRAEAMKYARKIAAKYPGACIEDGRQEAGSKYKTIEVGYERYDAVEGWIDCCAYIFYK